MSAEPPLSCLGCGAALLAADRFCEVCGAPLTAARAQTAAAPVVLDIDATVARTASAPAPGEGCRACGAPGEALGGDGYCTRCGVLRRPEPEHDEIDLGVAAGVSDQGRVHRRNEDAMFLDAPQGGVIAVVCDGISSSTEPQLAARSAARAAGGTLAEGLHSGSALIDATTAAVTAAQRAVLEIGDEPTSGGDVPACTLVSGVYRDDELVVGWVGDSRAYWITAAESHQLTVDDSWATEQVAAGLLSAEQALADPRAHAVTRWLGADAPADPAQIATVRADLPGRLVLCSDGLWNYAPAAAELAALVASVPAGSSALAVALSLVEFALAAGGRDNVTVAVIDVRPPRGEFS